ncbi:MAG: hypothetical protein ACP5QO_11460 [Clostridia bacterium]
MGGAGASMALVGRGFSIAAATWVPFAVANSRQPHHPEGIAGLLEAQCAYHDDGVI